MAPTTVTPHAGPRKLTRQDFKTLGLSALGGALEFYDFIIFVFFATVISQLFFPPDMPEWLAQVQTFGIFAAGYLVRPIGGIILAHFGDKYGRKRVFAFSILLMSLSTLGMALMPTYASIGVAAPIILIVLRMLQGAAIGGEVPAAWTFVAEHVPSRHVGFSGGFLCSGLTLGILLGSLIATAINAVFPPETVLEWAWRIPFLLGGIFGLMAVYLRRWLHETPVFLEMSKSRAAFQELPIKTVLRNHGRGVIVSMLMTWILSGAIVVTTLMTATFLQRIYGYTPLTSLAATSVGTLFLIFGCNFGGWLIDRIGGGRYFIITGVVFALATFSFYTFAGVSPEVMFVLYAIMGLSVGMVGGVPYVLVRAFPAPVRFSGMSFAYNVAYAIAGGLTPIGVVTALGWSPMAPAYYLLFIAGLAIAMGVYFLLEGTAHENAAGIEEAARV